MELILVYKVRGSVRAVNLLVFAHAPVAFTAHVQKRAAIAVSTEHFFSPPIGALAWAILTYKIM